MVDLLPVVDVDQVPPERIRTSLASYRWLLGAARWEAVRAWAPAVAEGLRRTAPPWLDELGHWAAVAGTDLDDLLVLNARTEVLSVVRPGGRRGECTVVAEPGILGQTWDWFGRQREAMVVLQADGLVTVTEAGMLAKVGVNRHGLAVGLTYLGSAGDGAPTAGTLPVHAVLRLLLERSRSVTEAVAALHDLRLPGSACFALADPADAAFFEITPGSRAVLPPGAHTNHCLDPQLRAGQGPVDFLADSERRLHRAAALRATGVPVEDLLADTDGGLEAIDQPPDPALDARDRTETVLAVVVDPGARALHISPGRPSQTGFAQVVAL